MDRSPYDYTDHEGLLSIPWSAFHSICRALAAATHAFDPKIALPILRGGLYPGGLVAHILQIDLHPIRLSRREVDTLKFKSPQWMVEPPGSIVGKRVLIVDEICDTGETVTIARERVHSMGVEASRVGVLYAHSWGAAAADYICVETDSLILNPWDREIYKNNSFQMHPEYSEALQRQGREAEPGMILPTSEVTLAKGCGEGQLGRLK